LEFLNRLPTKQKLISFALIVLAAGIEGVPFEEDMEDIIDTVGQHLGYMTNTRKTIEDTAVGILGEHLGGLAARGVTGLGLPLDIQSRLGFGNLLPGTAMLKPSAQGKEREVLEVFGAGGGVLQSFLHGAESAFKGDVWQTGRSILPKALKNAFEGMDMVSSGIYKDYKGRHTADVDLADSFIKFIGFHPTVVSDIQRNRRMLQTSVNVHRLIEAAIADQWAKGVVIKNKDMIRKAIKKMIDWNKRHKDMPIHITGSQIRRRIKTLRLPARERYIRATPKEMRELVSEYY